MCSLAHIGNQAETHVNLTLSPHLSLILYILASFDVKDVVCFQRIPMQLKNGSAL